MNSRGRILVACRRLAVIAGLLASALIMLASATASAADQHIRTLVPLSANQFPEGLTVAPDGTILMGILNTGEIMRITPNGTAARLAQVQLPANGFLVGLAALDSTNVYALVSSQDDKNGVWLISQHGRSVAQLAKLTPGVFPNDLVIDRTGRLYVTDTIGGRVYRISSRGEVELWVEHRLLLGNVASPGPLGFPIGANGIAFSPSRDAVYVAVSEGARIVRIALRPDEGAGAISVVAENRALDGADGIDVAPNGTIYAAVNGQNQIVAVDPATGRVDVVASGSDFHFPAVNRFSPDFRRMYVTNFDAPVLFGLAPGPARPGLLAMDVAGLVPQPAAAAAPRPAISPPSTGSAGLASDSVRNGYAWPAAMLALFFLSALALAIGLRFSCKHAPLEPDAVIEE